MEGWQDHMLYRPNIGPEGSKLKEEQTWDNGKLDWSLGLQKGMDKIIPKQKIVQVIQVAESYGPTLY